jgi:hypothetical protein
MRKINGDKNIWLLLFSTAMSCLIGFSNQYPLVYPDTGSYLYSGFSGLVFSDRPIFYGLFLRHISLSSSPWYVILVQGFLISWLLLLTISMCLSGVRRNILFCAIVVILTVTTGFSYTVSILLPDIFTPMLILSLVNLLLNKQVQKWQLFALSVIYTFSLCTQFSSFPVLGGTLLIIAVCLLRKRQEPLFILVFKRLILCSCLFFSSLLIMPAVNYCFSGKFNVPKATHVFVVNHLLETGILEDYLRGACPKKEYKICEIKEKLGWNFIWSSDGTLNAREKWEVNRNEYEAIIKDVLTTPKYITMLLQKTLEYSLKQFFTFDVTVSEPQLFGSAPFGQINWRFKDTSREYIASAQSAGRVNTRLVNSLQIIVVPFSLCIIFLALLYFPIRRLISFEIRWLTILIILHNILNSVICSNLSTVDPRFQNRVVWLLPFCAILIAIQVASNSSFFVGRKAT